MDLTDRTIEYINESYTGAKKEHMLLELYVLADQNKDHVQVTCTKGFVKREVDFGKPWPRLVSAREDCLRAISAVLYSPVSEQVYSLERNNNCMIKGLNDDELIDNIIEKHFRYPHHLCMDIGSFDAAQSGPMWFIEKYLF